MTPCATLLVLIALLRIGDPRPQSEPAEPPALVGGGDPAVPVSRGGSALSFTIPSTILHETRRISVVLPASYSRSAAERRYPVIVVVDGDFLLAPVAAVVDELARNGQIPESVLVGIENAGGADEPAANEKRVHDLTPPGLSVSGSSTSEGGDRFLDFIEQELLPAVGRRFRTGAPRTFVGVSSGAVLATYAAATRSTYRAVVSLDAPVHLGENWLAKRLIARASTPGEPVRYASLEARFGWPEETWRKLVESAPASWRLHRETLRSEGHETMAMLGAYLGLREVFGDYSRLAVTDLPATNALAHYASVDASLGARVIPPRAALANVVEDLLDAGRGREAKEAYEALVFGYGAPPDAGAIVARIAEVERRPATVETVEQLLSTPFPSPDEARAYVGEWVGDVWMGKDEPRTRSTRLVIRIADGRVVGETLRRMPDGSESVKRWEYMQITPRGMTWGNLNGMRPRGVALFEGTLVKDTLSGTMRLRGIDLHGDEPPPLHFSFERVHD